MISRITESDEADEEHGRCFLKTPHLDILLLPLLRVSSACRLHTNTIKKLSEECTQVRKALEGIQSQLDKVTKERDEWKGKHGQAVESGKANAALCSSICSMLVDGLASRLNATSRSPSSITADTVAKVVALCLLLAMP